MRTVVALSLAAALVSLLLPCAGARAARATARRQSPSRTLLSQALAPTDLPAPAVEVPSCISAGYSAPGVTVAWASQDVTTVQVGTSQDFGGFVFSKPVAPGTVSTAAPTGFFFFSDELALDPNTTYYVRTFDGSAYSAAASFVIAPCDSAPTDLIVTPVGSCLEAPSSGAVATLSWTGAGVTFSEISTDPSFAGVVFRKWLSPGSRATSIAPGYQFFSTELSVDPGATYYVRVYNGSYSMPATLSIPACPLTQPSTTLPSCLQPNSSGSGITISWTDAGVTGVQLATAPDFGGFVFGKQVAPGSTSTTAPDGFFFFSSQLTLNPNTTYYARTTRAGASSPAVSLTVPSCNPVPSAPTITRPSCIDSDYSAAGLTVAWSDPHVVSVDMGQERSFAMPSTKAVPVGTRSTTAPAGFLLFGSQVTIDPNVTYFARVYNGSYSSLASVYVPNCPRPPLPPSVPIPPAGATKIMVLGDSISQGTTSFNSYRRPLWFNLADAGFKVDFVGTMYQNYDFSAPHHGLPPNPDFDLDHEAHWGWTADQVVSNISTWATASKPDYALVDLGSNDVAIGQSVASTISDLGGVIDGLRQGNSKVTVLLAKMTPSRDPVRDAGVTALNAAIPGLAAQKSTAGSPVVVVDQNSGFDPATDTWDGLHPNGAGEEKMATRWFEALNGMLPRAVSLTPTADAYVTSDATGRNFGAATQLQVDGSPVQSAYLKFDASALKGKTLVNATLRIRTTSSQSAGSPNTQAVRVAGSTSWSEASLTYKNRPSLSTALGTVSSTKPGTVYQVPLNASALQPKLGGLIALGVNSSGSDGMYFSSRETADKPQLILTIR